VSKVRKVLGSRCIKTFLLGLLIVIFIALISLWRGAIDFALFWKLAAGTVAGAGTIIGLIAGVIQLYDRFGEATRDPIRFSCDFKERFHDGIIEGFDRSKIIDFYESNNSICHSCLDLNVNVDSERNDAIRLAPYIVIGITKTEPIPETVDYVWTMKGGAFVTAFSAAFSPERHSIIGAPQANSLSSAPGEPKGFDRFDLEPTKSETFMLPLIPYSLYPGYYYHFRVAIQYANRGRQDVVCSDCEFVVGVPSKAKNVWAFDPREGKFWEYSEYADGQGLRFL
jgi:hypothetical protein